MVHPALDCSVCTISGVMKGFWPQPLDPNALVALGSSLYVEPGGAKENRVDSSVRALASATVICFAGGEMNEKLQSV